VRNGRANGSLAVNKTSFKGGSIIWEDTERFSSVLNPIREVLFHHPRFYRNRWTGIERHKEETKTFLYVERWSSRYSALRSRLPIRDPLLKFISLWHYSPSLDHDRFFSFLIFYRVGRTPWTRDEPVARPLPAHRTAQTQIKHTQTSMPEVGFEPTIPMLERAKIVHALDRTATVIGTVEVTVKIIIRKQAKGVAVCRTN
jgi:hypothetical protein